MIETLAEWNEWWSTKKVNKELIGKEREITKKTEEILSFKEIKTLVGIRRCGKSTLLYQFIDYLLNKKKVEPKHILFINFEDPILSKATFNEIFDIYQANINPDEKPYIFLDEVNRCKEWTLFLRKLYDLKKIKQVFITDSTSKFISSEYVSSLTGRKINLNITPLSFSEFLDWNKIDVKQTFSRGQINKIKNLLNLYLNWGGLPEVVKKKSDIQKKILLNNYLNDIIHKDIVERYNANFIKIKELVDYIISNSGSLFSPRKYSRTYNLSLDSINTYIGYLKEVFLFQALPKFDYSLKKQQINPKKLYVSDTGFIKNGGFSFSENIGRLYEHLVFIELLRRGNEIYYWKNKFECDFIVKKGVNIISAIQVCKDLNSSTKEREIKGLIETMNHFNIKEGIIVNDIYDKFEKIEKHKIKFIPLWKFILY